ncbi:MAG: sigma-54-dependent Fis family transcriptional regulator, partial [Lentisphaerae bacterium]|nr:sigma-54-dependent Fis family transcriptional regulator [Lentisphaerota bacterium]
MRKPKILLVEDDTSGRRSVSEALEDAGCEVVGVESGEQGIDCFSNESFDVVLTDLVLPGLDGVDLLGRIRELNDGAPVLIMTAYGTVPTAVAAMKAGAYDYITKPLDLDDLQTKIKRAVEVSRLRTEVSRLRDSVADRFGSSNMIAESAAMQAVVRQVRAIADTAATVLLQGESGTGKEVVARALHADGSRNDGPFIAVNCGAFADTLLESELFGHEKGAFTGARELRRGAFERANGGTIFLDEVGNAPENVQVKLLRILEDREVTRVGGERGFTIDARVISASNRDLDELVAEGRFREDLLYRLRVVTIELPPLRDRIADIRPLADRFVTMACETHGRSISGLSDECYEILERHDWPGNVRELRNVIESAVVMASGTVLRPEDMRIRTVNSARTEFFIPDGMTLEKMEKTALLQVLGQLNGNRTLAAEKLGVSR